MISLIDTSSLKDKLEPEKTDTKENRLARVCELLDEQEPWIKYDRTRTTSIPQKYASKEDVPVIYEAPQTHPTELFSGSGQKKTVREARQEYDSKQEKQPEQREVMDTRRAAELAERIYYCKIFGTLNHLGAEDKERYNDWKQDGPNKVLRDLALGPRSRMKGYHASM